MPRVQNPELRDAFDVWQEPGKACKTTRCRYCGETRSGNSSRQLKHLRTECPNYRDPNARIRNEARPTAPSNGPLPGVPPAPPSSGGTGYVDVPPSPMAAIAGPVLGSAGFRPSQAYPAPSPDESAAPPPPVPPPVPPPPAVRVPHVPRLRPQRFATYNMSVIADEDYAGDDPDEQRAIVATLAAYYLYRRTAHRNLTHRRRSAFHALPQAHQALLSTPDINYLSTLNALDDAIEANAALSEAIFRTAIAAFGVDAAALTGTEWLSLASNDDIDKVKSTLKQFCRDWSEEGDEERHAAYEPVLTYLRARFPDHSQRWKTRVLVPGAGLGRLAFDICMAGFAAEGNEFSFHQLMASHYVLNCSDHAFQHPLRPFIHSFSNHRSRAEQLRVTLIPDVHPASALLGNRSGGSGSVGGSNVSDGGAEGGSGGVGEGSGEGGSGDDPSSRFSMAAGDFCELYGRPSAAGTFAVVATVFFIDTAPNLLAYLEAIWNVLEPNGHWVNYGPLLWHYEDAPPPSSTASTHYSREVGVELTLDEVLVAVERCGFRLLQRRRGTPAGYTDNAKAMLRHLYEGEFWVAEKMPRAPLLLPQPQPVSLPQRTAAVAMSPATQRVAVEPGVDLGLGLSTGASLSMGAGTGVGVVTGTSGEPGLVMPMAGTEPIGPDVI